MGPICIRGQGGITGTYKGSLALVNKAAPAHYEPSINSQGTSGSGQARAKRLARYRGPITLGTITTKSEPGSQRAVTPDSAGLALASISRYSGPSSLGLFLMTGALALLFGCDHSDLLAQDRPMPLHDWPIRCR
jgi:hypothetical protein